MSILIILGIICIILYLFAKKMGQVDQNIIEKRMEPINQMNNEYEEKLQAWCKRNNIIFKDNITQTNEIWVNQTPGYIWFSNKDIVFCPDALNCGTETDIANHIILIKYNDIKYFTKDGTISYTNEIIDNGKNISVSGAVIGGLIAGEAGAIIGSRKDINKIENVSVKHDEIYTYVYFEKNNEVKLVEIKGNEFYQRILHLIPEKEYNCVVHKTKEISLDMSLETTDIKLKLKDIKSMFDEGLITEEEYNDKKSDLLSKM